MQGLLSTCKYLLRFCIKHNKSIKQQNVHVWLSEHNSRNSLIVVLIIKIYIEPELTLFR